jgi:hypothetical protein
MRRTIRTLLLALVVSSCDSVATYRDITGQQRPDAALQMDGAMCQQVASGMSAPAIGYGCTGKCVALNTTAGIINQDNAFQNCMLSRGWQETE